MIVLVGGVVNMLCVNLSTRLKMTCPSKKQWLKGFEIKGEINGCDDININNDHVNTSLLKIITAAIC